MMKWNPKRQVGKNYVPLRPGEHLYIHGMEYFPASFTLSRAVRYVEKATAESDDKSYYGLFRMIVLYPIETLE